MTEMLGAEFLDALERMPEFLDPIVLRRSGGSHAMGGFAALGNPSSFHNPVVRSSRMMLHNVAVPLFKSYAKASLMPRGVHLEQLIDRMMYRPAGKVPTAESWHRDQSKGDDDDLVFGGWLALDDSTFSCVPGTHLDERGKAGFVKVDEKDVPLFKKERVSVQVPAGSWIVFHQSIVHEVVAIKRDTPQRRLFAGWRLTVSDEPLQKDILQVLADQGVPLLPSGQQVPMYAALHWTFEKNLQKLVEWSAKTIKPELLVIRDRKGKAVKAVPRYFSSLKALGLPMYRAYTDDELKMHLPQPLF